MVHPVQHHPVPTLESVLAWVQTNPGCSLVYAPTRLSDVGYYVWDINDRSRYKAAVSIIICTLDRPESLNETLRSLTEQSFKDFEVILITAKGSLSELRDQGLRSAVGSIVVFIDDDVHCPRTWLENVVKIFEEKGVVGVSGPTVIEEKFRNNRDLFRYRWAKALYDRLFLEGRARLPGKLSSVGAPTTGSNDEDCKYEGEVDYLEACNMAVQRKEAIDAGGFSPDYVRTSEWCEVDMALRLRGFGHLRFSKNAGLYHRPSRTGVYHSRLQTHHRWTNFKIFQERWVRPSFKRNLYWGWVWVYLKMKNLRMI